MIPMKRVRKILLIIGLCAAIITAIPATNAEAEVRVTVTFAAGGAACGVYFFFYFSSRFTGDWQNKQSDATALFNHSPEGWQVRPPSLQFIEDHQKGYTPYADIIRIRF
jgi:hypothetical protein